MQPRVGFVITEHQDRLDETATAAYARAAGVLAEASGGGSVTSHYLETLPAADTLVLSGSWAPWALHDRAALDDLCERIEADGRPVLGICAGMQLLARHAGGSHDHMADTRGEHGFTVVEIVAEHPALAGLPRRLRVFQEHGDEVTALPDELELIGANTASPIQAFISRRRPWWGTQFHPERYERDMPDGRAILEAFFRSVE
ncbi:MAG: gamma-glutamyl-gamma-aminobutyrate hydrolase family protein [Gaiellales bacterium]